MEQQVHVEQQATHNSARLDLLPAALLDSFQSSESPRVIALKSPKVLQDSIESLPVEIKSLVQARWKKAGHTIMAVNSE